MTFSVGLLIGSNKGECGYCHSEGETSCSFGIWMYTMTVSQYQLMIDRGWRRSGKYLYKPDIAATCCPPYAIRLDSAAFTPRKSQSKVLKKMQKYLLYGTGVTLNKPMAAKPPGTLPSRPTDPAQPNKAQIPSLPTGDIDMHVQSGPDSAAKESGRLKQGKHGTSQKPILARTSGICHLFDVIEAAAEDAVHKLTVVLEPSRFTAEMFELYQKYQMAIHNDTLEDLTESKFTQFLVDTPLKPWGDEEQFGSFHQKYYLDGALMAVAVLDILPNCVSSVYFLYDPAYADLSLGTYSALREISTTSRLSEKYPSLKYYYLGIPACLTPGYYIHSCPKMAYKAKYDPSELLCPVSLIRAYVQYSFQWFPAASAIRLIESDRQSILCDPSNPTLPAQLPTRYASVPRQPVTASELGQAKILVGDNRFMPATVGRAD
ncbi:Arginyl-tRNA--protein transferase 1 [Kappamyces sp. JEL0829]|nr:Arginyl-tRNA--protein transferase 1 [Kappamyces sp. JEL0829]